jgi:hypothetical protein
MAQIEPIVFPLNQGTATEMKVLIHNFTTYATTCKTNYDLITAEGNTISSGTYTLTEQEFADWGNDNTWVEQCVADAIGVVITTF